MFDMKVFKYEYCCFLISDVKMLNMEEKRIFEWYIKPLIEKIGDIADNYEKIYGTNKLIDGDNGEKGLWVAFNDIWNIVFELEKWVDSIYKGEMVKKESTNEMVKRITKKCDKEHVERKKNFDEGWNKAIERVRKRFGVAQHESWIKKEVDDNE